MDPHELGLAGFHHLTAITARAPENYHFYTGTLGMRLVKKTVNQDDVSAYHLFYADGRGTPGTDLTFFDWPARPEGRGSCSIVRTGLRVRGRETLDWWRDRLAEAAVRHGEIVERDGRPTLDFEDPEGQRFSLVADETASAGWRPWEKSPVPAEHQIRGLGPVTISVRDAGETDAVLREVLAMTREREYWFEGWDVAVVVYRMKGEGPAAELHLASEPDTPPVRPGAGGAHHVAFRVRTIEEYQAWEGRLRAFMIPSSGPVDRFYFQSLYFREPNGILFELATDEPGFAVDESQDALGERLALPPFLEQRRQEIEAGLKPLSPE